MLTQNRDRNAGFINGVSGIIDRVVGKTIIVKVRDGFVFVYKVFDATGQSFFPILPSYAQTALKCQGQTLNHITWAIDRQTIGPAVAYMILSRVKQSSHVAFATHISVNHFKPIYILD